MAARVGDEFGDDSGVLAYTGHSVTEIELLHAELFTGVFNLPPNDEFTNSRDMRLVTPHGFGADPFQTPSTVPGSGTELVVATLVDESEFESPRERVWTAVAIVAVSLFSILMFSVVMRGVTVWVLSGEPFGWKHFLDEQGLQAALRSRLGLFLMVVIPQLGLVAPSLIAAALSPVPFRQRLGLVRGQWPVWTWGAVAAMTPLVGLISTIFLSVFMQESESLKEMSEIFRSHGKGMFIVPLALMIGATPAFCEELLFRGYVQTRLTRSLRPSIGIVFASVLFAAFHMDYVHALGVLPLGLFLGWVTWRSGSIVPAMLGHFVNNALSVVLMSIAGDGETTTVSLPVVFGVLVALGCSFVGFVGVIAAAFLYEAPRKTRLISNSASIV